MSRHVHGRCHPCGVIWRWPVGAGWPLLRNAFCPRCGRRLEQTAASLAVHPEIIEARPLGAYEIRRHEIIRARGGTEFD